MKCEDALPVGEAGALRLPAPFAAPSTAVFEDDKLDNDPVELLLLDDEGITLDELELVGVGEVDSGAVDKDELDELDKECCVGFP